MESLIQLGRLFLGNLFPTGPLAITATKVPQIHVIALDTVEHFFVTLNLPVHKKMAFPFPFRALHLAPDPL
jgi:hypothetical protein